MAASPKARLLPRVVRVLLQKAAFLSGVCYLAGVVGILLLPGIAKETYVDENALSPGMAVPEGSYEDMQHMLEDMGGGSKESIQTWVLQQLDALGVDSCIHHFAGAVSQNTFSPSDLTQAKSEHGQNFVGIVRAPRGEGNECLVLVTPLSTGSLLPNAIAVAMGFGVIRHLASVPWLAKDVIWVVADGHYGADYAVSQWLASYYSPRANSTGQFLRGGAIQVAVALQVDPSYQSGPFDLLELRTEGPNGEMPNMDIISTVTFLNRYQPTHGGLRFEVARWKGLSKYLGPLLPLLRWATDAFGRPSGQEYDRHLEMLAGNMHRQAVGMSTGVHGAFRRHTVDALTLVAKPTGENRDLKAGVSKTKAAAARRDQALSILKVCSLLEATFRCFNNLLERFHHSVFLYVLASPTRFVSIAEYMIPFALLLVTLPLTAAALSADGVKSLGELRQELDREGKDTSVGEEKASRTEHSDTNGKGAEVPVTLLPGNWTSAVTTVTAAYLGGAFLWRIAPLILEGARRVSQQVHLSTELTCAASWAVSAIVLLTTAVTVASRGAAKSQLHSPKTVHYSGQERNEEALQISGQKEEEAGPHLQADWVASKSATLAAAGLALGALVNLDFALALLSAGSIVPLCLLAQPLRKLRIDNVPSQNLRGETASKQGVAAVGKAERAPLHLRDVPKIKVQGAEVLQKEEVGKDEVGTKATVSDASKCESQGRTPSMVALCAQVREQFAKEERRREEARVKSNVGRLKSAVTWVLKRRRAIKERIKSKRGGRAEQSRQSAVKRVALTAGALLVSATPFLVLTWEEGQGPSLSLFVAKLDASLADSISMGWLVTGYLPTVALCLRILGLSPVNPFSGYLEDVPVAKAGH